MCDCYIFKTVSIFIIIEIILLGIFYIIAPKGNNITARSFARGIVERFFLVVALLNNYPHAIAFFGTLKLGTRLTNKEKTTPNYNDFYLVGNLLSVLAAFVFVYWYKGHYN